MSNPYTSQSISGYNSNPPPDDGTESAANTVKWATHKDKLGDPLKTLAEAINTEALAAFGKILGQGVNSQSGNYSVVAGDQGNFIAVTAAATITLLDAATAGDGFCIAIVNTSSSAEVIVDGSSSETINGSTSHTLGPGGWALLTCNSTSWTGLIYESYTQGSFTATVTGMTSNPTPTMYWTKHANGIVVLTEPTGATGTSNSTSCTITGLPAALHPANDQRIYCECIDNGSAISGRVSITSAGGINLFPYTGSFTASGAKGLRLDFTLIYSLYANGV